MTDDELLAAGYKIDKQYQPLISREKLKDHLQETCFQYYERNFEVIKYILKVTGERGIFDNIMLVLLLKIKR